MTAPQDEFWQIPKSELDLHMNNFRDFFDPPTDSNLSYNYREVISKGLDENKKRLLVSVDDLREFDKTTQGNLAHQLIHNPRAYLQPLETALNRYAADLFIDVAEFKVGITGQIGENLLTPRQLSSRFISQMICLDGIVTKTSLVNPKLVKVAQYCPETNQTHFRTFNDVTSMNELPSRLAIPTTDLDNNPLEMEFGRSVFIDHQLITVQERPETAPAGQMPRSCDVILDYDLADCCKPGDRVKIYGVYRILSGRVTGQSNGIYRAMVIANNVEISNKSTMIDLNDSEIDEIKAIARERKGELLDLLSRSIAPSIYGQEEIKKALTLLLIGGTEKNLGDGTHIRGDINVLMVGDPSTAKSQLLRSLISVAPLAVHTTGRGSSGVGLTASVTSDPETGERRLEAGAMVIADRGVVCIDEFDKMDEADRVAIHEALEQQTVTISKAGIHTSLHARCSVCAAANPVWGNYNPNRSPMDNVGLPDSLLSRFDLLFIVLDVHNPQMDARIADHVLRTHRWRGQIQEYSNGIYVQSNPLLHGTDEEAFVTVEFLKKYIAYAKQLDPELEQKAIDKLVAEFAELRSVSNRKTQPITPRAFETLIRLATASAKLRLSKKITAKDAETAISLLRFAIYGETDTKANSSDDSSESEEEYTSQKKKKKTKKVIKKKTKVSKKVRQEEDEEVEEVEEPKQAPPSPKRKKGKNSVTQAQIEKAMREVFADLARQDTQTLLVESLMDSVEEKINYRPTQKDIDAFLEKNSNIGMKTEDGTKIYTY